MDKTNTQSTLTKQEATQLEKLKKKQASPIGKYYIPMMIFFIAIIYIVDEVTSNIGGTLQPFAIREFFVSNGVEYTDGLATYSFLLTPGTLVILLLPFYKTLSDKFGRKPFLILNTVGMGISMLVCMLAPNIYIFVMGGYIARFFVPNDMQVMYIMEVAPEKHRVKIASATKAIGYLGVMLVPVLMQTVMNNDDALWKNVYYFPIILAFFVSVCSYIFFKETPVFLSKRISQLEMKKNGFVDMVSAEQVEMQENSKKKEKVGVFAAIKFIFTHKQTKWLIIAAFTWVFSVPIMIHFSSLMALGGMSNEQLSTALIFFPMFNAIFTFLGGFLTDAVGRKKSGIIMGLTSLVVGLLFVFGTSAGFPPVSLGIFIGIFSGLYWSVTDLLMMIIPTESAPTYIRASVIGIYSVVAGLAGMIPVVLSGVLLQATGNLHLVCGGMLAIFIPLALLIFGFKVRETKGVDLEKMTGAEYN